MKTHSNPEINKPIGALIKERRLAAGLTQMKLADKLNVSYQTVQKFENGETSLTPTWAVKFALALGVEFGWFWSMCSMRIPYQLKGKVA